MSLVRLVATLVWIAGSGRVVSAALAPPNVPTPPGVHGPGPGVASPRSAPPSMPPISIPNGATADVAGFELHVQSIDYNDKNGDFTIPNRFSATRDGTEIIGDRAHGNSHTTLMQVAGNVVIHQTQPLQKSGDLAGVGQQPATLTCDTLDVNGKQKTYTATGHVHYTQGTRSATADRGSLNQTTHLLHMEGHVRMQDNEQSIQADAVDYDTITGEGHAKGNVIMRGPAPAGELAPNPPAPRDKGGAPKSKQTPTPVVHSPLPLPSAMPSPVTPSPMALSPTTPTPAPAK